MRTPTPFLRTDGAALPGNAPDLELLPEDDSTTWIIDFLTAFWGSPTIQEMVGPRRVLSSGFPCVPTRIGFGLEVLLLVWCLPTHVHAQLQFSDQTLAAGSESAYRASGCGEYGGGVVVADLDRDGGPDLFLPSDHERPDTLYINQQNGTFVNEAARWGLESLYTGLGTAVGDVDNDGWIDVFVAAGHAHRFYLKENGMRFRDATVDGGVDRPETVATAASIGATFADYDLDGALDLFVAGTFQSFLYRNDGNGHFEARSEGSGLEFRFAQTLALAPRLVDMDGDRYTELLLAADHGTSGYFVNIGDGTFRDQTFDSGTGLDENGLGQAVADFNGDGRLDWYVTSIFYPHSHWSGNKLYLNRGDNRFDEVAESAGVADGGFGGAAVAVDFDHDGDVDLAETNGTPSSVSASFGTEQSYLWVNDGTASFSEVALDVGFEHFGVGHGMVNLDYDLDGDQDVVIFGAGPARLLRNDLQASDAHWLRVTLDTTVTPDLAPDGLGSLVRATADGKTQIRSVNGGDNYVSSSELSAHFGFGNVSRIDRLTVEWTNGTTTTLDDVPTGQTITIRSPAPRFLRSDANSDGSIGLSDAIDPLTMLFLGGVSLQCHDAADVDDSGAINITAPVLTLQFLFLGNVTPTAPFPNCGEDPTDANLDCQTGRLDDC